MLVLSRKVGQRVLIGDDIAITVVRINGGGVRRTGHCSKKKNRRRGFPTESWNVNLESILRWLEYGLGSQAIISSNI